MICVIYIPDHQVRKEKATKRDGSSIKSAAALPTTPPRARYLNRASVARARPTRRQPAPAMASDLRPVPHHLRASFVLLSWKWARGRCGVVARGVVVVVARGGAILLVSAQEQRPEQGPEQPPAPYAAWGRASQAARGRRASPAPVWATAVALCSEPTWTPDPDCLPWLARASAWPVPVRRRAATVPTRLSTPRRIT